MAGDDPGLLVVPGSVAGELEDLSGQIFHDGGQVDRGSGSNPLGVVSLTEKPGQNELQSVERGEISHLWIRPTGNWRPARLDLDLAFTLDLPPLPRPDIASLDWFSFLKHKNCGETPELCTLKCPTAVDCDVGVESTL